MLWSLFLGARRAARRKARFSHADDALLQRITTRHFPAGYTIQHADGGWYDPTLRKFVREESRQVLVTANSKRPVVAWARAVGGAFAQHEVMLVRVGQEMPVHLPASARRARAGA